MNKNIILVLLLCNLSACGVGGGDNGSDFNGMPVIQNVRVLEQVTDENAPVHLLRYVTSITVEEVIAFYKEEYREPLSIKEYEGTTVLSYKNGEKNIKVQLSSAPNGTDVYLMYEQ
ncbi:hypothetical protein GCM10008090_24670 [Arenicella chitinivorans]|uniref:Uncharacterized protein n=1 Tax=Arenicella chitinivorans TaxID=1329800 RepID=A0A918VQC4_9GAMM|nr:hypothetical protein [Arenicella chitinivorans]GHA13958.1 hypothetical protein GCM10008090_24670 [Arenicella chitinivorans]